MANAKKDDTLEERLDDTGLSFPNIGEDEATVPEEGSAEARLVAAEEQLQKMQAQQEAFDQERQRWQQTVDRLIQGVGQPTPAAPPTPQPTPGLDFRDLPDPVDKPEDFKQALAKRFGEALDQRVSSHLERFSSQSSQQQQRDQALDDMWNTFRDRHQDLADKQMTLRGAVEAEMGSLKRMGVDPVQGMLADSDGFIEKVANRMRSELGVAGQAGGEQGTGQAGPNRTAGVAGSSNSIKGKKPGGDKQPPGFIEQMKKQQEQDGLI